MISLSYFFNGIVQCLKRELRMAPDVICKEAKTPLYVCCAWHDKNGQLKLEDITPPGKLLFYLLPKEREVVPGIAVRKSAIKGSD